MFLFFFSSRRRHTRCGRDWSSDVCSSDLAGTPVAQAAPRGPGRCAAAAVLRRAAILGDCRRDGFERQRGQAARAFGAGHPFRTVARGTIARRTERDVMNCDTAFDLMTDAGAFRSTALMAHLESCPRCRQM